MVMITLSFISAGCNSTAANFSRVGLSLNVADLLINHIFIKKGNKLTLSAAADRMKANKHLGVNEDDLLLDQAHRALGLYRKGQREPLLRHLARVGSSAEMPFWRVLTALGEVLPAGSDDQKQTTGLLADRDSLLRESKQLGQAVPVLATGDLFA
jgi:putative DNA methylase